MATDYQRIMHAEGELAMAERGRRRQPVQQILLSALPLRHSANW